MKESYVYARIVSVVLLISFPITLLLFPAVAANSQSANLAVTPSKSILSPALIKKPIQFKGHGFQPDEIVVVEMILPTGIKIQGVESGENVGLAYATTDNQGCFEASMQATATLNWFFQVKWRSNLTPDFKKAKPIPPGKYDIIATGISSGSIAKAVLEILPPPARK